VDQDVKGAHHRGDVLFEPSPGEVFSQPERVGFLPQRPGVLRLPQVGAAAKNDEPGARRGGFDQRRDIQENIMSFHFGGEVSHHAYPFFARRKVSQAAQLTRCPRIGGEIRQVQAVWDDAHRDAHFSENFGGVIRIADDGVAPTAHQAQGEVAQQQRVLFVLPNGFPHMPDMRGGGEPRCQRARGAHAVVGVNQVDPLLADDPRDFEGGQRAPQKPPGVRQRRPGAFSQRAAAVLLPGGQRQQVHR